MSTEAFIYDAIRTPRGKGKKDGSLHEVKPVNLLAGVLAELQQRNGFDTAAVDDVVMGVVSPVGEQGSVIAKVAALKAGWDFRAPACKSTASAPRAWRPSTWPRRKCAPAGKTWWWPAAWRA
jgi:acetyl-CoA acetyltransferase